MPYKYRDTNRINTDPQTTTGAIVEIDNSDNLLDLTALSVGIDPIQDLHGYDAPWVGGAGKNKLDTSNMPTATASGVTFSRASDGTITVGGKATAAVYRTIGSFKTESGVQYTITGTPSGGASGKYRTTVVGYGYDYGSGYTFTGDGNSHDISVDVYTGYPSSGTLTFKPMIRLASETDATYEPYTNICPISGWDSVKVTRTGRNFLENGYTGSNTISGVTFTANSDGSISLSGTATAPAVIIGNFATGLVSTSAGQNDGKKHIPNGRWKVPYTGNNGVKIQVMGSNSPSGVSGLGTIFNNSQGTFTIDDTYKYNWVRLYIANGTVCDGITLYPMILREDDTSTAYEPYQGDTYTIDLNGTRYGGTLDVTSGVLKDCPYYASYNGETLTGEWISDRDEYSLNTSPTIGAQVVNIGGSLSTVQLAPTEVSLLLGTNNIWANSGDVSATAVVDVERLKTLPTEAVSIDGRYLENLIEGYSTLYVKGRESLDTELNTFSVGVADGEFFKNRRYPARVLTVGFQLLCPNAEEFRVRFNQLNNILSIEEADFIFADEQDKYFTGTPIMDAEVEAGRNNVTGEWHIFCGFPFKRSVALTVLSSDKDAVIDGNKATFTFTYNGSYPSKPLLRATFASAKEGGDYNEDGDCGYIAFFDDQENIIQLGNPDVLDVDELNKNGTLANSDFDALTGWTASGISVSGITDQYWDSGVGQTLNYATGIGTLSRQTTGAVGFEFDIVHRLCVSAAAQAGSFKALLMNGNDIIVGFIIEKTGAGTTAQVKYILNDKVVGTDTIDVGLYNTSFGYCNRTPVYVNQTYKEKVVKTVKKGKKKKKKTTYVTKTRKVQSGWSYTQSNLNSGISRDGGVVTFSVGNLAERTFKMSDIDNTPAYDVVFETTGNFHTNAIRSCAFIRKAGVPFAEIPNVFTAGDVVEADCNDANVYLYRKGSAEGHLEPQYGALGNDWEDFSIKAGTNVIAAAWSEWVDANYKPKIEIIFNEVNI